MTEITMPDFESWARNIVARNYENKQNYINAIAEALRDGFSQGKSLGQRSRYIDLTGL